MAGRKSNYDVAKTLLELVRRAERGDSLTIKRVEGWYGVDRKTATRYIGFVKSAVPLIEDYTGVRKRWFLDREAAGVRTFSVAAALALGMKRLSLFEGTRYHSDLNRLAMRIRGRGDPDEVERLDRFCECFFAHQPGDRTRKPEPQIVEQLIDCLRLKLVCRISYQASTGARDTLIEPWCMGTYADALYLIARKHETEQVRTYLLTELTSAMPIEGLRFKRPSRTEFDPEMLFEDSFGIFFDGEPITLKARVRGSALNRLRRRPVHASQKLGQPDNRGWTPLAARLRSCIELQNFIMSLVPDIRIDAPGELRDAIGKRLRGGLRDSHPG